MEIPMRFIKMLSKIFNHCGVGYGRYVKEKSKKKQSALFINFEFFRKTYECLVYLFNFFHVRNTLFQIIYKFGPKLSIYLDLANFNTNFIWKLRSLTQLKSKIIFLKLLRLELIFLQYLRLCLCLQF